MWKYILERTGFPDVWMFPASVNSDKFISILKTRLKDLYISEWSEGLRSHTSLTLYREIKSTFEISPYLLKMKNRKYRNAIAKVRLSSHQLAIEKGRHANIERNERKCFQCTDEIEDEFHFILSCPVYEDLRKNIYPQILLYKTKHV